VNNYQIRHKAAVPVTPKQNTVRLKAKKQVACSSSAKRAMPQKYCPQYVYYFRAYPRQWAGKEDKSFAEKSGN